MDKIYLIHWNRAEAEERVAQLKDLDYDVSFETFKGPATLRIWREHPPKAFVIDLSRLPSQGRDVALAIRYYKTTRYIPIVLVDGPSDKVVRIRELLPDVTYTFWKKIDKDLKHAIDHPPADPVKPRSMLEGYSSAPLTKKLGIKANSIVVLINAPSDFETTLGNLPENVSLFHEMRDEHDLIILFTRHKNDLEKNLKEIAQRLKEGAGAWIAWPKKTSGVRSNLSQNFVRQTGLAMNLVDFKVCSIDTIWSGLKFTRRKIK